MPPLWRLPPACEALCRNLLKEDLGELLGIGCAKAEFAEKGRLDHARTDCVDADVARVLDDVRRGQPLGAERGNASPAASVVSQRFV